MRLKFSDSRISTKSYISKLMEKWLIRGSVCGKMREWKIHVLNKDKVGNIQTHLQISSAKIFIEQFRARWPWSISVLES